VSRISHFAGGLSLLVFLGTAPSQAAENVVLSNGFSLLCDHREVEGAKVRLFTTQGSTNFVEVDASEIASVEVVPDPIPAAAEPTEPAAPKVTSTDMNELIAKAGAEHNLDVDLLASVIRAESGGNVRAVSRTGAQGLMQLMPATAAQLGVTNSFAADQNIHGGTAYLDALLIKYHDQLALALAAYNAGPAAVDKYHGIPPYRETQAYVARVIREFNRRKELERSRRSHG
jgi:soluble lytic murein transglycosylase-like protein